MFSFASTPIMEHNLESYRTTLLRHPSYCASPVFLSGVGWQVEQAGHVLVDKLTDANTVAIVVGRVSNECLFVTPNGNCGTNFKQFGGFSKIKFLFLIEKPNDTPFAEDFDKALENFEKIQTQIASTRKHLNFISSDDGDKLLRFTRNVFEKRVFLFFHLRSLVILTLVQVVDIDCEPVDDHYLLC